MSNFSLLLKLGRPRICRKSCNCFSTFSTLVVTFCFLGFGVGLLMTQQLGYLQGVTQLQYNNHLRNIPSFLIASVIINWNQTDYIRLNQIERVRFGLKSLLVLSRSVTQLRVSGARTYSHCAAHAFRHKCRNPQLCNNLRTYKLKFFTTRDRVHKITMQ